MNEIAMRLAIAYAQTEFSKELRTDSVPLSSEVPPALEHLERFSNLVSEAYEYYGKMKGTENIFDDSVYKD